MDPGTRLGRYEIISTLGAGAMGEVYRAKDTKIRREVAVKVLPQAFSSNSERLRRFEQEAHAAGSINHPNLLVVHDVGVHDDAPYVVSELLEGQTLRELLGKRPLPLRKALDYAFQIAQGLSAAHEKGIIHRDLKPENIFITEDGRAKILDFGIAKLMPSVFAGEAKTDAPTVAVDTNAGTIVGTVGYMSPEQVRGEKRSVDHRSDLFSFGAVLYEMLTGRRAFQEESAVETMNAILNADPLEPSDRGPAPEARVERLLRRCLEKKPEDRFQTARDLAFYLETLAGPPASGAQAAAPGSSPPRRGLLMAAVATAVVVAAVALSLLTAGWLARERPQPTFSQLTFRRGTIWNARFTPDEDTIVYAASFDGDAIDVFSTRRNSPESRSLGLAGSSVLAVSTSGEMAILRHRQYLSHFTSRGTLARMPLAGTTPRLLLNDVQNADWSPDGTGLAIVRHIDERDRIEYPVNKVLYESDGWISDIRVARRGDTVAFLKHSARGDNRGWVALVNLEGEARVLSGEWSSVEGLAWSADESEVWFTAKKAGEAAALYAVTLSGQERVVLRTPAHLKLHDISRSGRVLLSRAYDRTDFVGLAPGEAKERNLSWLDRGRVRDISSDGKAFIFTYWGEGSGWNYTTYLRKTDGSPAVPVGDGAAWALSPDGSHVLAILATPSQIVLLPTDVGESKSLEPYGIEQYGLGASWLPDGEGVVFIGREKGAGMRSYVQSVRGGPPRPVTPEGVMGTVVSPDGKQLIAVDKSQAKFLYPLGGEPNRPLVGIGREEQVVRWSDDPRFVYVYNSKERPVRIYRFDLQTGARKVHKELMPTDPTGILGEIRVHMTPDGRGYLYDFRRYVSDLYLIEGPK